jgi:minor histocompatibility antigen H13
VKREEKGEDVSLMKYLVDKAVNCPKHYFAAVNVGYLIAIICTIVVMLVFDHGQPALLYLVPGCILTVLGTAVSKGELSQLFEFSEDEYITPPDDGDEDDKKEK